MINELTLMSQEQAVTNRQLAASVRFGRRIVVNSPDIDDGAPVEGYVAGFDTETIFLAVPLTNGTLRKLLVHRDGYSHIELLDESSMRHEPKHLRDLLDPLLAKFRERILDDYFPRRA